VIDLSTCVFVVDGLTEIRSFKAKFEKDYNCTPGFRKHPSGGGGRTTSARGYANAVYIAILLAMRQRYTRIVCVTDREGRSQEATSFAAEVRSTVIHLIESDNHYSHKELEEKLAVCVADRMFENWIIADVEGIKQRRDLVKPSARQAGFDGKNGVGVLKSIMKVPYKKVQHAPALFKSVSFQRAIMNSPSFRLFAEALGVNA
jgi:hypothetical protein